REAGYILAVNRGILRYRRALAIRSHAGVSVPLPAEMVEGFQQAVTSFDEAHNLLPGQYVPSSHRALIALHRGEQVEADTQIHNAEQRGAPPRALAIFHTERGRLFETRSDHQGAVAACRKALEYQCCDPPALILLGRAQLAV